MLICGLFRWPYDVCQKVNFFFLSVWCACFSQLGPNTGDQIAVVMEVWRYQPMFSSLYYQMTPFPIKILRRHQALSAGWWKNRDPRVDSTQPRLYNFFTLIFCASCHEHILPGWCFFFVCSTSMQTVWINNCSLLPTKINGHWISEMGGHMVYILTTCIILIPHMELAHPGVINIPQMDSWVIKVLQNY